MTTLDEDTTPSAGKTTFVGLGQLQITTERGEVLVARSLGSTAAIALHDPVTGIGGLLHWMLPTSSICAPGAERNPKYFADTGLPLLIAEMVKLGSCPENLVAALAGAASLPEGGEFDVGNRNRSVALSYLERQKIKTAVVRTGGVLVRELSLEVGAGEFVVRTMNG